jgi:type VII secretion system ESX-1 substrate/EndoU nuclease-like protein
MEAIWMSESIWLKPVFRGYPVSHIPGDPSAIRRTVQAYEAWSGRLNDGGASIKRVNTDAWEGAAAEAFWDRHDGEPKRWFDASDRVLDAARALDDYAYTLEWAQREVVDAYAEWRKGHESSRTGTSSSADPAAWLMWQQQEYAERAFGASPRPAYAGDSGAATRSHALWRMSNATGQLEAAGDDVAAVVEAAAEDLPIHRNFLENVGEFLRGVGDNVNGIFNAVTDPAGSLSAAVDRGRLWFTNPQASLELLIDKEGHDKNLWRWNGSMLGGLGIGRVGRYLKPRYLPKGVKRGYYDKYRAGGHAPLPGRSGGDGIVQVRGENLNITPDVRERASYLNPYRMDHIIERHGPDTPYPDLDTTMFPGNWSHDKVFSVIQDVVADPSSEWVRRSGEVGSMFRSSDAPAQFTVNGFYEGHQIRVGVEPYGEGIITGFIPK